MKYQLKIAKKDKIRKIISIIDFLKPFSDLNAREKDVLAIYIRTYLELKKQNFSKEDIFKMLFQYEHTMYVSEELSEPNNPFTESSVRNYVSRLRRKGLLDKRSINEDYMPLFENIKQTLTFEFIDKD